jgi:hypothetical protein
MVVSLDNASIAYILRISAQTATTLSWDGRDQSPEHQRVKAPTWIIFDLYDEQHQHIASLEAPEALIGVTVFAAEVADPPNAAGRFSIPPHITAALRDALPRKATLWIKLQRPFGYLPIVPWEALFLEGLYSNRVLRYSRNAMTPLRPSGSLDAALCFSLPSTAPGTDTPESIIARYLNTIPSDFNGRVHLHIFADAASRKILTESRPRFGTAASLEIYDPSSTAGTENDGSAPSGPLNKIRDEFRRRFGDILRLDTKTPVGEAAHRLVGTLKTFKAFQEVRNPWLLWMRSALPARPIDYVHFFVHGSLGIETGGIAFAAPATTNNSLWSSVVRVRELDAFLNSVGAWATGFSSPPGNSSVAGLRYLLHDLSKLRCGPLLLNDMLDDVSGSTLRDAYRFFRDPANAQVPKATIVWHPNRMSYHVDADESLSHLTLANYLRPLVENNVDLPTWIVQAQRGLEATANRLDVRGSGEAASAVRKGVEKALSFTRDVIADQYSESKSNRTDSNG